jgi:electron transport complex protein RnfC
MRTFPGGVHPRTHKEHTRDKPIQKTALPRNVVIPLIQHTGAPCLPKVGVGDYVKRGQLLAENQALITSPVHASISGTVKAIGMFPHPLLGEAQAIMIEGDGNDAPDRAIAPRRDVTAVRPEEMLAIIKACGIVGLGGAAFPTHVKLMPPRGVTIDTLLVNGAECEPYLSCDHRLMMEKPAEIIKGLAIILKILNIKRAFIAIEDNKRSVIPALNNAIAKNKIRNAAFDIRITVLKTKYPQGGEKQLIKAVLDREVPPGKLPFEVGCVVSNVGTVNAIYEAVYENKPLYERVITVSGTAIGEPQNLLVRIGTPVSAVITQCGGLTTDVEKVIIGGPMTGIAHYTLEIPVIKGTSGIVVLSKKEAPLLSEFPCIKCGRCLDVCPVNLMPTRLYQLVRKERWGELEPLFPLDCIECGACGYECPSRIPLIHYIKQGKMMLARSKEHTT